jgi:hypothetical protein
MSAGRFCTLSTFERTVLWRVWATCRLTGRPRQKGGRVARASIVARHVGLTSASPRVTHDQVTLTTQNTPKLSLVGVAADTSSVGEGGSTGVSGRRSAAEKDAALDAALARSLRDARVVPSYSRIRRGALTFGPVGRVGWSVVPALIAFVAIRNVYRSLGDVTLAFYLVMAVPLVAGCAYLLCEVWKRDRVD